MMELVVVIGIIMILVGLMAPSLGRVTSQAKLTRDISLIRQHSATVSMYAADFADTYPYPYNFTGHLYRVAGDWALPMIASGHFENVASVDPDVLNGRSFSYMMSIAMVYNPDEMRPGHVPRTGVQTSRPTRQFQVLFPSLKGLIVRENNGLNPSEGLAMGFCCEGPWISPVAFSDGSSTSGTYRDFQGGLPLLIDQGIGIPIISTWFGVRGIDR